ncbi:MAG: peptidoglycan-associated lipoprotein Pal [Alphaproteobacteria bacterium]|nr:peptidoglycan-associated lipoprotein Pal [Alphaproteobacteria bacterium]
MLARYFVVFSAVFLLAACTSASNNNGGIDAGPLDGMNGGVIVDSNSGLYTGEEGPTPGTQADLVVNVGDRVFFDTDSSELTPAARTTLENQSAWLAQYMYLVVVVEGHADERGTREYNLALGERRGNAVKNYLVALGVSPSRIATVSYGKERPAVPGANEGAWAQNRRSVTKVQ